MINKNNVSAKVIADSVSAASDVRLTTLEITLPKVLLAEFNTHRVFSRNFSSSRAIPTKTIISNIDSFVPEYWGENRAGMTASPSSELPWHKRKLAEWIWSFAIWSSKMSSLSLNKLGLHKQWANRPNDWHTIAKGVVTSTEWDNFFTLRDHSDAQPEMQALAKAMKEAINNSVPIPKYNGEWHLPYVTNAEKTKSINNGKSIIENALRISVSCCAQVSYRKLDDSLEKAEKIYDMLLASEETKHLSPFEHQAMVGNNIFDKFKSNFGKGWIQHRKLIEDTGTRRN